MLAQIREVVNAKEEWARIKRVRKPKDRKVILGYSAIEEWKRVKERLRTVSDRLIVEEVKNKNPILILWEVLAFNTYADIMSAMKKQNRGLFDGISDDEFRAEVKFHLKVRN